MERADARRRVSNPEAAVCRTVCWADSSHTAQASGARRWSAFLLTCPIGFDKSSEVTLQHIYAWMHENLRLAPRRRRYLAGSTCARHDALRYGCRSKLRVINLSTCDGVGAHLTTMLFPGDVGGQSHGWSSPPSQRGLLLPTLFSSLGLKLSCYINRRQSAMLRRLGSLRSSSCSSTVRTRPLLPPRERCSVVFAASKGFGSKRSSGKARHGQHQYTISLCMTYSLVAGQSQ
jgi:hypothetical protein